MKLVILFIFVFLSVYLFGQDYFMEHISFDEGANSGVQIEIHNNKYFVLSGHFCGTTECSSIAEVTSTGDTLWRTIIPDVDVAKISMTVYSDTISVAGNNHPFNTLFRMARFDLEGQKIGETIDIEHPTEKFTRMFQQNTVRYNNNTLVIGRGIQNDTMQGLIYVMDNDRLDTLIRLEPQDRLSRIWEVNVTSSGELVTFHEIEEVGFDKIRKVINKFDKDLNHIWRYQSEDSRNWEGGSVGAALEDGRVVLVVYSDISSTSPHSSIRAINPDGSTDWQHDVSYSPFFSDGTAEIISRVKYLPSGDILCMGRYSSTMIDTPLHDVPFIYKMTTDGEVLWKRAFYSTDVGSDMSRNGIVRDVIELDNGDLYGIGRLRVDGQYETFIFKVNSDGCLDPDDCGLVQVITDVEDISKETEEFTLYPNPTTDVIYFEATSNLHIGQISIVDIHGHRVGTYEDGLDAGQLDLSWLAAGVYVMRVRMRSGEEVVRRFLKG